MNLAQVSAMRVPGWANSTVGTAAVFENNLRFPINQDDRLRIAGEYPYYGPTGVLAHINEYRVDGTYVLIGEDGDHFLKFREKPMTLLVTGKFNVNNHAHLIKGGSDCITEWLYYFFMHTDLSTHLTRQGVGRFKLTKESLGKLPLLLPPLPEQRKIAEILTTWDEALEKLDALIAAQDRRKQGLMQQLLTGQRRFAAHTGSAWVKTPMGDVLERVVRPITWSEDLPLSLVSLRRRCGGLFRRPEILASEYKTQDLHELRADDFLVSKRQVVHGAWALVTSEFTAAHVSKEYVIFVNRNPARLHMAFFAWLAQTPRMIRLARVASTGVHIEKLIFDPDVFLRESIRIPPTVAEQEKIAKVLDAAESELRFLRTQRTALDQQKRGLMQRLLTGRVRVNVPGVSRR